MKLETAHTSCYRPTGETDIPFPQVEQIRWQLS